MINGKGNDLTAPMIVADHFERCAIRVEIDGIWIELTLRRTVLRQRVVAHQYTLLFQSMIRGSQGRIEIAPDYPFDEQEIFGHPSWPKLHFVEKKYAHDETNWWIPNRACVDAMLRSAGFEPRPIAHTEVYLCRLAEPDPFGGAVYPARPEDHS